MTSLTRSLFSTFSLVFSLLFHDVVVQGIPQVPPGPVVKLSYGSFQGTSSDGLDSFLGVPFAAPPTGDLRFGRPKPPIAFKGLRDAVSYGPPCPQQAATGPIGQPPPANASEDCLFINVIRPSKIPLGKQLPVIFYIYGGAFEVGDASQFPSITLVQRSIDLNKPVIYVSANYRVTAFGFLGGKEVQDAGIANAGIHDQRFALQWVQKYISTFGGDPKRVTIWGLSAGAISVGLQMVINDGHTEGLFQGAFMQSGSPSAMPDALHQQVYFDQLVNDTNCTTANDKLKCLRSVPFTQLMDAVNLSPSYASYQGLRVAWQPMVDGVLFQRDPLISLQQGKYAKVPFVTGDAEDEGTIFSLAQLNITTNAQYLELIKTLYFPNITSSELNELEAAYPEDVTQGSPFDSGTSNALSPEYKRLAAIQGDLVFQSPRRNFLEIASKTQPAYSYRYKRGASTPQVGAAHGSDVNYFFGVTEGADLIGADSLVYFVNSGNPNAPNGSKSLLRNISWEKWSSSRINPPLLTFVDPAPTTTITSDTYRAGPMKLLHKLTLNNLGNGL